MAKGVVSKAGTRQFVQQFGAPQLRQRLGHLFGGQAGDTLQDRKRHLAADHGRNLQYLPR